MKQSYNTWRAISIRLPLSGSDARKLKAGDLVNMTGIIITARDASHKEILKALSRNSKLPFSLNGQTIYYMGPTPTPKGKVIGSAGPTTSSRMDKYTVPLLEHGLKCMIGKGRRSALIRKKMLEHQAVYLAAVGGAGALLSRTITEAKVLAFAGLGTEAVFQLSVKNFPAVVINDVYGNDLYEQGRELYGVKSRAAD